MSADASLVYLVDQQEPKTDIASRANTQSSVSGPASSMTPRYPHLLNLSQRQFDNMFRPKRPRRATAWIADEVRQVIHILKSLRS